MEITQLTLMAAPEPASIPIPNFVMWIIIGVVAGGLARWLLPGEQKMNIFLTFLLGLAGAFFGGWGSQFIPFIKEDTWWMALIVATAGAFVLLLIFEVLGKAFSKKKA